jgi:hypothetical protein
MIGASADYAATNQSGAPSIDARFRTVWRIFERTSRRPALLSGECRRKVEMSPWARSMNQLIETIEDLRVRGIGFRSLTEALDTTTAQGRRFSHVLGLYPVDFVGQMPQIVACFRS